MNLIFNIFYNPAFYKRFRREACCPFVSVIASLQYLPHRKLCQRNTLESRYHFFWNVYKGKLYNVIPGFIFCDV